VLYADSPQVQHSAVQRLFARNSRFIEFYVVYNHANAYAFCEGLDPLPFDRAQQLLPVPV
jgi:hypothetical protein